MHIAIAGGHSAIARGASGYLDEYECDRAFVAKLIDAFDAQGWHVTDCSNEESDVSAELREECRIANESGADLFIAVHFNAGGGTGTEVWHYPYSIAETCAREVSRELASALGLPNRGAKSTTGLYVLNHTEMPAILIEVCFVDTEQDADAWWATSWDDLCAAVVRGIWGDYGNKNEDEPAPSAAPSADIEVDGIWGSATTARLQEVLGAPYVDGVISRQNADWQSISQGCGTGWEWVAGGEEPGSQTIELMQQRIGADPDGFVGPNTWNCLIRYFQPASGATELDGRIDYPSITVKAMQRALNAGEF